MYAAYVATCLCTYNLGTHRAIPTVALFEATRVVNVGRRGVSVRTVMSFSDSAFGHCSDRLRLMQSVHFLQSCESQTYSMILGVVVRGCEQSDWKK